MKLLVDPGADPNIPTMKGLSRPMTDDGVREYKEVSNRPAIPVGVPGVPPLVAAAGVGYGEGFAGNTHNFAPAGMMAAVKYLVEELGADVNAVDHEGKHGVDACGSRGLSPFRNSRRSARPGAVPPASASSVIRCG
jgi:uncharacterized protein